MTKLHILQFIDYAAPYKGNFISSLHHLEKQLYPAKTFYLLPDNARNIQWVQECLSDGQKFNFIERSFFSNRVSWRHISTLWKLCRKLRISIIHTHFILHNPNLFVVAKMSRVKVICHLHNHCNYPGLKGRIKSLLLKYTAKLFIGVSSSVTESAKKELGTRNVVLVRNAVDFTRLHFREGKNLNDESFLRILMFGWPYRRKGVDIAIEALAGLIKNGRSMTLNIVLAGGEDYVRNEIIKEFLYLPGFVEFLSPVEDIACYFNSHSILISASREEGFNYTLVEGAYCDCMLISSKINGIPAEIPGLELFDSGKPESLAAAIVRTISMDPSDRARIKYEQRQYVTSNYSLNSWSKKIIGWYNNLA